MSAQDRLRGLRGGMRIGLMGGSFDPPHMGHVHVAEQALTRFALDRVIWLVSPGNPLKPNPPAPLQKRCAAARALIRHPRIDVSDVEAHLGTRYTAETLAALGARHPAVRFTWIMGADNLAQFHLWDNWTAIMEAVPVGVLARPGQRIAARSSVASKVYRAARIRARASHALSGATAPAWCFVNIPMRADSSTALRAAGAWDPAKL